jgi:tetratricopeptide (TPR) repeat protein
MSSKVARLKPRVQPFDEAIDAYRGGRFSACLGALAQHSSASAVALAARSLTRLGRYDDARQTLEVALEGVAELSHRSRGELEMLRAGALARLGRHIEAECALDDARAYVFSAACPELEAEYLYAEAHMRMITGQYDACVEACSLAISRDRTSTAPRRIWFRSRTRALASSSSSEPSPSRDETLPRSAAT